MSEATEWLDDDEQAVWRRWLAVTSRTRAELARRLAARSDLSFPDFEVLVQLTDPPDGRARILELATALQWERSRLSHHLRRMEARGLVAREECADDGRGAYAVVTADGRAAIEAAAALHVRDVRTLVFDTLTRRDVADLGRVTAKLLSRLDAEEPGPG